MSENSNVWWKNEVFPRISCNGLEFVEWSLQSLVSAAIANNGPSVIAFSTKGSLDTTIESFEEQLFALGARKILESPPTSAFKSYESRFSWNDGACSITSDSLEEGAVYSFNFASSNHVLAEKIKELSTKLVKRTVSGGRIYTIKSGRGGLDIVSIGKASFPLERTNYEDAVLKDLDHVVSDLSNSEPCGRLIVINGEPGTGKTYITRGLLDLIPNALFITVPPSLIPRIGNPDFIPILLNLKKNNKSTNGPIIFLVEDADEILVPRNETGMDNISACLNLSDGLLGNLFDLRILATTNAIKANMDKAIMRPGRLCRRIDVGPLSYQKASEVFKRLTEKDFTGTLAKYTLAEIYMRARDNGWTPVKQAGKMGFELSSNSYIGSMIDDLDLGDE